MDVNSVWSGVSALVGATVVGVGTVLTWMAKNKRIWYPVIEAIGADPRTKQVVTDVQSIMAAKDSALRNAEIKAALFEGLLILANPNPKLGEAEKWIFNQYLTKKLSPETQAYLSLQSLERILQELPETISVAQTSEWYQALQRMRE